jgi:hypothetical protein
MPDKICKVCYNCEETFTMYRRRHHCRMCGQIFCDRCSSEVVDGSQMIGLGPGLHRSCGLCHELYLEQIEKLKYTKNYYGSGSGNSNSNSNSNSSSSGQARQRMKSTGSVSISGTGTGTGKQIFQITTTTADSSNDNNNSGNNNTGIGGDAYTNSHRRRGISISMDDTAAETTDTDNGTDVGGAISNNTKPTTTSTSTSTSTFNNNEVDKSFFYINQIQKNATLHIHNIAKSLINNSTLHRDTNGNSDIWLDKILSLTSEVVSNVDPDVRSGDSMDIKPYVKLKVIPGGNINDCTYIDGVVFRKNVSHKRMIDSPTEVKLNPKILVLSGGIEFQRTDNKLSSLDTLIEQEDKYITLLIKKILILKPTIILTGKAVARKAQELLCDAKVAVIQNVRFDLLERISRLTHAIMLPSTDHMIQQYGTECLGQ